MTLTAEDTRMVTLTIHTATGDTLTEHIPGLNAKRHAENLVSHGIWRFEDSYSVHHVVVAVEIDKDLDALLKRLGYD